MTARWHVEPIGMDDAARDAADADHRGRVVAVIMGDEG